MWPVWSTLHILAGHVGQLIALWEQLTSKLLYWLSSTHVAKHLAKEGPTHPRPPKWTAGNTIGSIYVCGERHNRTGGCLGTVAPREFYRANPW
jgi:hypothetical protein